MSSERNLAFTRTMGVATVEEFAKILTDVALDKLWRIAKCCPHCISFNETKEICILCSMRPPAKIIAFGCDSFMHKDEIPF